MSVTEKMILRGARLILPDRLSEKASLLIDNGRVASIIEGGGAVPVGPMQSIDLDGLTLFPGFIDLHIHGAMGVDTMEAGADDLHRVSRFLGAKGVTSWLPTLVPAPAKDYERAVGAIKTAINQQADGEAAARVLGVHYEGPFVSTAQCGALRSNYFRAFTDIKELETLAVLEGPTATRMMTMAPEIEGGIDLVRELVYRGWIVSIGHTRATPDVLDLARKAGAHHMTHFMNAMSPLHHRKPGPVGWGLVNDDVTCDVIADGVHVDPLMLELLLRCKTAERVALISDAVAPAGLGDGDYKVWGETITVRDGRTSNQRGSIAGSVITMLDAVRMMLSRGVTAVDVARMASTNPARVLGSESELGSIEEGKRADLVALDDAGNVHLTIVGGRVAFEGRD
ncbi:MAG: N-acetylglucosamine-6-phosphate deacetylase [Acidobacteriota bacterium]|nr:N-acetylglucosamine-6-phosphate deacetylase [Acidobacteriota bacterium]